MATQSKVVKLTAKSAFKGEYLKMLALGVILLFSQFAAMILAQLFAMVFGEILGTVLAAAINIFWFLPLFLGILRVIWQQLLTQNSNIGDVFFYFSSFAVYKRAIVFILHFVLRVAVVYFLLLLPGILITAATNGWLFDFFNITMPLWLSNLWIISSIVRYLGIIIAISSTVRYYLAPFLFITNDEVEPLEALHMSVVISKDNVWDFFVLLLSFIGYLLLSIFVFPQIYVLPYIMTAFMVHCRFTVAQYNKKISLINNYNSTNFVNF